MGFHFSCIVLLPQHIFPCVVWQGDMTLGKWDGRLGGETGYQAVLSPMLKEALTAISGALSQTLGVNRHLLGMRRIKNRRSDRERTSNHHLDFHLCVAFPLCLSTGISWMLSLGVCEAECPPSLQTPSTGVQDHHFYFHHLCSVRIPFTFHTPETAQILCSPD